MRNISVILFLKDKRLACTGIRKLIKLVLMINFFCEKADFKKYFLYLFIKFVMVIHRTSSSQIRQFTAKDYIREVYCNLRICIKLMDYWNVLFFQYLWYYINQKHSKTFLYFWTKLQLELLTWQLLIYIFVIVISQDFV